MHSPRPHPLVAIACLALTATAPAAPPAARPVSTTVPVREPLVTTLELTGSLTARRQSRLSARTSGLIQRLQVDAGHSVNQGDILMELDSTLATLALDKTAAQRRQAELELADAERLLTEGRNLAKVGGFSRSEAETRETNTRVRRALLESLTVEVREQEEIIARHRLPAPFSGVISRKLAEEGEWVQTGTPVLELVETGTPWLDVQAPQEAYASFSVGQEPDAPPPPEITVHLDAFPDIPLPATVAARVPVKDLAARTFLVRLELDDPRGLAAPGMSARVRFTLRSPNPVVQVARDAVVRLPDGTATVWVIGNTGGTPVAQSRPVELGRTLNRLIEVRRGLDDLPPVVVRGNESLRENQPVTVLPEAAATAAE
jgi:RND family efflux transporter MFP subunit